MSRILLLCATLCTTAAFAADTEPVTVKNFPRAETDMYFSKTVEVGEFGKFMHLRQPTAIDEQRVIRMNRDTLYSSAVFDLDAGPVTIVLPDAGKRFMSLQLINEDHYAQPVVYAPGTFTFTRAQLGTRYFVAAVRTPVNAGRHYWRSRLTKARRKKRASGCAVKSIPSHTSWPSPRGGAAIRVWRLCTNSARPKPVTTAPSRS